MQVFLVWNIYNCKYGADYSEDLVGVYSSREAAIESIESTMKTLSEDIVWEPDEQGYAEKDHLENGGKIVIFTIEEVIE